MMAADAKELLAYVPPPAIRALLANSARQTPFSEPFTGCLLLADLVGFTPLTESYVARGRAGVEELSAVLNDFLSREIETVDAYGGEVVRIAGDGLVILWPCEDGDEAVIASTLRATQCAFALQSASLSRVEGKDSEALRQRIGIETGRLLAVHVGGDTDHRELLLAGAPLRDASQALLRAAPGDVVLGPGAH